MTGRMDRVKTLLRTHEELCSLNDLYRDALSNARNDISTLALRDGWHIEKWWTQHGDEAHKHYQLVRERSALSSSCPPLPSGGMSRQGNRLGLTDDEDSRMRVANQSSGDDDSAVRAGGRSSGIVRPISPKGRTPTGEATTGIRVPARTVQQLTLAEGV